MYHPQGNRPCGNALREDFQPDLDPFITRSPALFRGCRAAGLTDEPALRGKWFDQFSMIITAAVASLGAGLLPAYLIEEELGSGRLVRIGDTALHTDKSYFVVTPAGEQDELCRRFIEWIRGQVSDVRVNSLT